MTSCNQQPLTGLDFLPESILPRNVARPSGTPPSQMKPPPRPSEPSPSEKRRALEAIRFQEATDTWTVDLMDAIYEATNYGGPLPLQSPLRAFMGDEEFGELLTRLVETFEQEDNEVCYFAWY